MGEVFPLRVLLKIIIHLYMQSVNVGDVLFANMSNLMYRITKRAGMAEEHPDYDEVVSRVVKEVQERKDFVAGGPVNDVTEVPLSMPPEAISEISSRLWSLGRIECQFVPDPETKRFVLFYSTNQRSHQN